jgi:hypothetical protein
MPDEHKKELDDLSFLWDPYQEVWDKQFIALKNYKELFGDFNVPQDDKSKEYSSLGRWVLQQRNVKKITPERKKLLENIGFIFDFREELWIKNFNALIEYKKEFGDCLVPTKFINKKGLKLGLWVGRQRQRVKSISPERKKQLDDLSFVWDISVKNK